MRTRVRIAAVALVAVLLLPLAACGVQSAPSPTAAPPSASFGSAGQRAALPEQDAAAKKALAPAAGQPKAPAADRMVIRDANVRLEVKKVLDAVSSLRGLAGRFGGVVSDLQIASDTGELYPQSSPDGSGRTVRSGLPYNGSITILVPAAKFDAFRAEAEKLGRVLSENSADQDVTQQHVDLKARLTNAKAEEARLRSFFDKAESVTDMLSIERELARVRGDIESMTARLASLERQAAMATLTIELVEPKPIVRPSTGIDWGFGEALTTGIQGLVGLLKVAIVLLISTAPLWLLAIAAVFIVRWRLRVRRARSQAPAQGEGGTTA